MDNVLGAFNKSIPETGRQAIEAIEKKMAELQAIAQSISIQLDTQKQVILNTMQLKVLDDFQAGNLKSLSDSWSNEFPGGYSSYSTSSTIDTRDIHELKRRVKELEETVRVLCKAIATYHGK